MATARITQDPTLVDDASMVGAKNNQHAPRLARRFMVLLPVVVRVAGDGAEYVGLVRDIGERSLFLYSDLICATGAHIKMILKFHGSTVRCHGEVMRVERRLIGAPVGMAIRLDGPLPTLPR